jgi:hypothetical protein
MQERYIIQSIPREYLTWWILTIFNSSTRMRTTLFLRMHARLPICGAVGLLGFVYTLLLLTVWLNFLSFQTKVAARLKSLRLRPKLNLTNPSPSFPWPIPSRLSHRQGSSVIWLFLFGYY